MALNYPGPYEVRIYYDVAIGTKTLSHVQRVNVSPLAAVNPGDEFSTIDVDTKSGIGNALDTIVDGWIAALQPLYGAAEADFNFAELWAYAPNSFDATFISAYGIGLPGTGSASLAGGQWIASFRTIEGGSMKISLMETNVAAGPKRAYAGLSANEQAIVNYVQASTGAFLARDTSFPLTFTNVFPGQNEKTFKQRYR